MAPVAEGGEYDQLRSSLRSLPFAIKLPPIKDVAAQSSEDKEFIDATRRMVLNYYPKAAGWDGNMPNTILVFTKK